MSKTSSACPSRGPSTPPTAADTYVQSLPNKLDGGNMAYDSAGRVGHDARLWSQGQHQTVGSRRLVKRIQASFTKRLDFGTC